MRRASPLDAAREQRERAERALADANTASTRLQEARDRARRLLGGDVDGASGSAVAADEDDVSRERRRMAEIERRMYASEELMRRAEAGIAERGTDDVDPAAER